MLDVYLIIQSDWRMKQRGINYDVGTKRLSGGLTRENFLLDDVKFELNIITNTLHCNAVRISGQDIQRIVLASEIALQSGMTVWFSPALQYASQADTMYYLIRAAGAAEKLRLQYGNLVFVAGCELSLFTEGFIKGDTGEKRMSSLFSPLSILKNKIGLKRSYNKRLNRFLKRAVNILKEHFGGKIAYASGTWEKIEWENFDFVGIDHYRALYNKASYRDELRNYISKGKPLSIMEFGCCTYHGASDKGAMGWAIIDWTKAKPELKGKFSRDEKEQSDYIADLLQVFQTEGVFAAFVFTFMTGNYIYSDDPRFDLDLASYGIVKVISDRREGYEKQVPWVPKLAFYRLGKIYSELSGK